MSQLVRSLPLNSGIQFIAVDGGAARDASNAASCARYADSSFMTRTARTKSGADALLIHAAASTGCTLSFTAAAARLPRTDCSNTANASVRPLPVAPCD